MTAIFLSVAAGEGANVAGKVALQSVGQALDIGPGNAAFEVGGIEEKLLTGEIGVERRVGGEIANVPSYLQGSGLGVEAEHPGCTAGGPDEVEEETDGGGLACAVGAKIAENAAGHDLQVEIDDAPLLTVVLSELLQLDDGVHIRSYVLQSPRFKGWKALLLLYTRWGWRVVKKRGDACPAAGLLRFLAMTEGAGCGLAGSPRMGLPPGCSDAGLAYERIVVLS